MRGKGGCIAAFFFMEIHIEVISNELILLENLIIDFYMQGLFLFVADSPHIENASDCGQCITDTMLKHLSLVLLTLQNAILILVMRYTRTRPGDMYHATTAVVMSEILKVITSLVILATQEKTLTKFVCYLRDNIWRQPMDCLKVSVPSIIYTLQNNLLYIALSNLDAATFQVSED